MSYREFLDTNVPLEPDTSVENVGDCYLDSDSEYYSDYGSCTVMKVSSNLL